jgi:hypothetical protein
MTPSSKKRSAASRRVSQNKSSDRAMTIMNPIQQINATINLKHRFRYTANNGATNVTVTRANLLNNLMVNISSSTGNWAIISALKLDRIEMVSPAISVGAPSTISVEWLSTYGPSVIVSDTSNSTAIQCVVRSSPPRNSLASFWSLSNSNESDTIMNLNAPTATVVDVWVTMVLNDGINSRNATTTASGTQGILYASFLDGPRSGAVFVPVSVASLN